MARWNGKLCVVNFLDLVWSTHSSACNTPRKPTISLVDAQSAVFLLLLLAQSSLTAIGLLGDVSHEHWIV